MANAKHNRRARNSSEITFSALGCPRGSTHAEGLTNIGRSLHAKPRDDSTLLRLPNQQPARYSHRRRIFESDFYNCLDRETGIHYGGVSLRSSRKYRLFFARWQFYRVPLNG